MKLAQSLASHGLYLRGVAKLTKQELTRYDFPADKPSIALVGNIGSSYWASFTHSDEYLDGESQPLDRWSRRIAAEIASEHPVQSIFPFTGPPYYPFQQWAQRAEGLDQSPLGILIHPEYGLWHSYRFALLGEKFELDHSLPGASPCIACDAKPCTTRCPVGAISDQGYDAERCATYLRQNLRAVCHEQGCLARYACPVAPNLGYTQAQSAFHLRAFLVDFG